MKLKFRNISVIILLLIGITLAQSGAGILFKVNTPSGRYNKILNLKFETNNEASIYYTLDGKKPSLSSKKFSGILTIIKEGTTILNYMAVDIYGNISNIKTATYKLDTRNPILNIIPPGGKFSSNIRVSVICNEPADIYYRIKSTKGEKQNPFIKYSRRIDIKTSCTVDFFASDSNKNRTNVSCNFLVDKDVPTLTFSKKQGIFNKELTLDIIASRAAEIYYTIDEYDGVSSFKPLSKVIKLGKGRNVIRAYAINSVGVRSAVVKKTYIIDLYPPKIKAVSNLLSGKRRISIKSNEKSKIYYTIDGTVPTPNSLYYRRPFNVTKDVFDLRVYAEDKAGNINDKFIETFSFDTTAPKITISPRPGLKNRPITLRLLSNEKTKIFYTMNNTIPTEISAIYREPIKLRTEGEIYLTFFAVDRSKNKTKLRSVKFSLDFTPPKVIVNIEKSNRGDFFMVELQTEESAKTFYEVGVKSPSIRSRIYNNPIKVKKGKLLSYFSVDSAGNRTATRKLTELTQPQIITSPEAGSYNKPIKVELSSNLPSKIYYRKIGKYSEEEKFSIYDYPISIKSNGLTTLEYYAIDRRGKKTSISKGKFLIDMFPPEITVHTKRSLLDSTVSVFFRSAENIKVYYTLDKSTPINSPTTREIGEELDSPNLNLELNQSGDIYITFIGEDLAGNRSQQLEVNVNLPSAVPSHLPGEYDSLINIELQAVNGAAVYYTEDGTKPDEHSKIYRAPLPVKGKLKLYYFAMDKYGYRGKVVGGLYIIDLPPKPDLKILPDTVFEGDNVMFDASASVDEESEDSTLRFNWDIEERGKDSLYSKISKIVYVFKSPGEKKIILKVKDNKGKIGKIEKMILVRKLCPYGMISLTTKNRKVFCIDKYEYPGRKGDIPKTKVTWIEASLYCRDIGKRLCTADEWTTACSKDGYTYPYGYKYKDDKCNTNGRKINPSGKNEDCISASGVYDLVGNVWEWTSDRRKGYNTIIGGDVGYGKNANCTSSFPNRMSAKEDNIGFRCCK